MQNYYFCDMKKTFLLLLVSAITLAIPGYAFSQDDPGKKKGKLEPVYDIAFYYNLDNREISPSGQRFTDAMTINAAQLTPLFGIRVKQGPEITHKVMAGIDLVRNMGEIPTSAENANLNNTHLFQEILMFYELERRFRDTKVTLDFGIFPRGVAEGEYTHPFMSDSVNWVSNNFAGFFAKMDRPRSHYEAGLDWYGMIGKDRREEFRVFSYGISNIAGNIYAGWKFVGHHYANSYTVKGVVDDILAEPFIKAEIPSPMQELYAELSWLQGMQKDRRLDGGFLMPGGTQLELVAGKWNVFLRNRLYWGSNLMPLYDSVDDSGTKYGANLYWGTPFYMVHNDRTESWKHWGTYDRMEFSWEPKISKYLDLKISAVLHFNEWKYSGWQQKLTLAFTFGN